MTDPLRELAEDNARQLITAHYTRRLAQAEAALAAAQAEVKPDEAVDHVGQVVELARAALTAWTVREEITASRPPRPAVGHFPPDDPLQAEIVAMTGYSTAESIAIADTTGLPDDHPDRIATGTLIAERQTIRGYLRRRGHLDFTEGTGGIPGL
ncbi:hypothetical protein Lfu02_77740 [Longispora fulva]|uniref:Uncharacterized protein n=1 Tax=Longispora fulva TaxID=619741 RepID=A0A8J7GH98_9ACTN|nr:hypothetical protein [Longispora fulva]MBG6136223.1 hypothetical protein [Longispora fulva]GIG63402.1 hypothetical protein Lfu02_77740 [Longispora fulva]